MNPQQTEVIASIHALSHTIRDEQGAYVSYSEHLHDTATEVVVSICTGHDGEKYTFHCIGSYYLGSIEAVRDELGSWLVEKRKEMVA